MSNAPAGRLAAALKRLGSDMAFGVPGGGPNLDVVGAMAANDIRFVLAHGETASCIMASVYGHLTGRPAAAVVTRGPGAASAANGAAQATLDRHPLVLVTDTVPARFAARVPHQRIDQRAMLAPVSKASATLGADGNVDSLVAALQRSLDPPAGAIHIDYDASTEDDLPVAALEIDQAVGSRRQPQRPRAAELIAETERPVVIVGLGALTVDRAQSSRLRAALETFGAPVLTTYQATGVLPSEHRLAAGLFTNGASERRLLEQADLIVAVGLDMVEPIPAPWHYQAPVLCLSTTTTVDPYLPIDAELIGRPADLVEEVLTGEHRWGSNSGAEYRVAVRAELAAGGRIADDRRLGPLEVVEIAAANAPPQLTTTVDAGAHFLAIMPFWPVEQSDRLLISNGLATMGYAVPAAIAAALARPSEPVLCFVGDGGLGMSLAELETIVRLELPITVVVFNDSALSLIKIKQQASHGGPEVVSYRQTDFTAVAAGFGMEATAVEDRAGLERAMASGWDRPRLIDATIDPSPYPHLIKVTRG